MPFVIRWIPVFLYYAILFRKQMPFTYDLAELGRYYRQYSRLMDHWKKTLPADSILEVRYEDIVADLDTQARLHGGFLRARMGGCLSRLS